MLKVFTELGTFVTFVGKTADLYPQTLSRVFTARHVAMICAFLVASYQSFVQHLGVLVDVFMNSNTKLAMAHTHATGIDAGCAL